MKILRIGRGEDCDIVIEDSLNQVSRRHATLRLYPLGKMEIISEGRNGTYRNGMLLKPGKPHKVTRKDVISFAHVKSLNWKQVPDVYRKWRIIIACCLAAIVLAIAGVKIASLLDTSTPAVAAGGGGDTGSSTWKPDTTTVIQPNEVKPSPKKPTTQEEIDKQLEEKARKAFPLPPKEPTPNKKVKPEKTEVDSIQPKKQFFGLLN